MTKADQKIIFASSCIESAATALNIPTSEVYKRMAQVGFIEGFIFQCYEALHSQSREHVTEDVVGALKIWEQKKGAKV